MELGTREYPLRNINLALLDIFNIHANTERSIEVFVMELTQNYLKPEFAQIINVTSVSFDSYSDYTPGCPQRAILVISDTEKELITEKAMFSIHQNVTKKSLDISRMELMEYGEIFQTTDYAILVNRANVSLNNFDVVSELSSPSSSVSFVYTNFCFFKTITFTNMHFEVQGLVFENNVASVNMLAENITLDMYKATGGFVYNSFCNYPEAMNFASIELRNINAYMSQDNVMKFGFLFATGNMNTTIDNMTTSAYMTLVVFYPFITFLPSPYCNPNDDETQIFTINNYVSTLPNNKGGEKTTSISFMTPWSSPRKYKFLIQNTTFTDRPNESLVFVSILGRYDEEMVLRNITMSNIKSNYYSMVLSATKNLTIDGMFVNNYLHYGTESFGINALNVFLNNVHFKDCHTTGSVPLWIRLRNSEEITITNFLIEDSTLSQKPLINYLDNVNHTIIFNFVVRNVTLEPGCSVIGINKIKSFDISNLNFENAHGNTTDSSTNYMIKITGIDFADDSRIMSIKDVIANGLTVGLLLINSINGSPEVTQTLMISNICVSK